MHKLENTIHVLQGQHEVSDRSDVVFSTVLGSCVAACFYDPVRKIGGMNHFLLPGNDPGDGRNVKYGAHAMEKLINTMLRSGAERSRMRVSLFGGGNVVQGLGRIGDSNGRFARQFAMDEGFSITRTDLGGSQGRRIRFSPYTGEATVRLLDRTNNAAEIPKPSIQPAAPQGNNVEFF